MYSFVYNQNNLKIYETMENNDWQYKGLNYNSLTLITDNYIFRAFSIQAKTPYIQMYFPTFPTGHVTSEWSNDIVNYCYHLSLTSQWSPLWWKNLQWKRFKKQKDIQRSLLVREVNLLLKFSLLGLFWILRMLKFHYIITIP